MTVTALAMWSPAVLDQLVAGIGMHGYAVVPNALPASDVGLLRRHAAGLHAGHELRPATVGHGREDGAGVRGDFIHWVEERSPAPADQILRALLEELRERCNRTLWLGLVDSEGHYSLYPPGAAYARHRDRFRDHDTRVLSLVLYLNEGWREGEGGALRLFSGGTGTVDVMPAGGTAVLFLSGEVEHEVQAATRPRWSFAAWLRRRPL